MSRIYEALQKAESERTVEPQRDSEQESPIAVADYDVPLAATERLEETRTPMASSPPVPPATPVSAFEVERPSRYERAPYDLPEMNDATTLLDLRAVPVRTWVPTFRSLPALLERGPALEQFNSLRSRIYELRDIKPLKSILVSSGLPQEGKSFIAVNLAISLARSKNSRVLLIDGDMRRYTVHQMLGCDSEPGLADYLSGQAGMLDILQRPDTTAIKAPSGEHIGPMPPLTVIAAGNGGDRAADLSNNPRFSELIGSVSPLFDWIIVDSSPVLPVSDAVNLSRACDGVLLVARGGITEFADAQRTQHELKAANVLGFVLNGTEKNTRRVNYYGYEPRGESN